MKLLRDPVKLCLIFVVFLAVLLRLGGVNPGYNAFHPDEGKDGLISAKFMFQNKNLDPMDYDYPSLVPILDLSVLVLVISPLMYLKQLIIQPGNLVSNLRHFPSVIGNLITNLNDLQVMYLGRYLTALFGVLTVILTYLVGRKLFKSRLAGLLSALVLTVNFRAVENSHFDLPDIYNSFFLLLALYAAIQIIRKPGWKNYLLSGIAMAVSFSVKLQFFSFIPFAVVHTYIALKNGKALLGKLKLFFSAKVFAVVAVLLIGVLLINFYQVVNFQFFISRIGYEVSKYGFGAYKLNLSALSYFCKIMITPFILFVCLLGVIWGPKNKTLALVILLSLIIPFVYYFFYLTEGSFYSRNLVTIIPAISLVAGYGLEILYLGLKKVVDNRIIQSLLFSLVCLIILFDSAYNSLVNTFSYRQPWSLTDMRGFLSSGVADNSKIASHPWDWYILFSLPGINTRKNLTMLPLDHSNAFSLPELRAEGADYALIGTDVLSDATSLWWLTSHDDIFWQKPDRISSNTFSALAANELFENTLHASVKPWQAPDNNYVFVKIPAKLDENYKLIASYSLNEEKEATQGEKIGGAGGLGLLGVYDPQGGQENSGSLKLTFANSPYPFVRWVSPIFPVKAGYAYKVKVSVKSDRLIDLKNRDGFVRLDFYSVTPPIWDEKTESNKAAISSRYFGDTWKDIEVDSVAPFGNDLATFSFEISNRGSSYWLDNIEIYESQKEAAPLPTNGAFNYHLPDNILVPFTNGNL